MDANYTNAFGHCYLEASIERLTPPGELLRTVIENHGWTYDNTDFFP